MAYEANPFLARAAEDTSSEQSFVRLFSPKVFDKIDANSFISKVHIFRSSPGGGKTTLFRAFSPSVLRAFFHSRSEAEMSDAYRRMEEFGAVGSSGPLLLSTYISCASGYADLPPGASELNHGLLRALLNARIVLRTLKAIPELVGREADVIFSKIKIEYGDLAESLVSIPTGLQAQELLEWARNLELLVYKSLDSRKNRRRDLPNHLRIEGIIWLSCVKIFIDGIEIAPRKLLMIDDLHKIRRQQRKLLLTEITELRVDLSVWLAERTSAIGDDLIAFGIRENREVCEINLEELWSSNSGRGQYTSFAQNILDRRFKVQSELPPDSSFRQYISEELFRTGENVEVLLTKIKIDTLSRIDSYRNINRYSNCIKDIDDCLSELTYNNLIKARCLEIYLARDKANRQAEFDFLKLDGELVSENFDSAITAAATLFTSNEHGIPYYYGVDRVCTISSSNPQELLAIGASFYNALVEKVILRRAPILLSPLEQEKLLQRLADKRLDFMPKNMSHGFLARKFIEAIGKYCKDLTHTETASIAPGVTGFRLSENEISEISSSSGQVSQRYEILRKILSECVAENLLIMKPSAQSGSRPKGYIFYLNRLLCVKYRLPLQLGGWQPVKPDKLILWVR